MKNKILITGSEGLIGNIIKPELEKYHEIYCLDIENKDKSNYFRANIGKLEQLENVFNKLPQIDIVIHLAGYVGKSWESILKTNIIGTRNIYEIARKFKVNKVIYASSNHTTGAYEANLQENNLVKVKDSIKPDGYYGSSKAFGEIIACQFYKLHKINSICLRIGHVSKDNKPRNLRSKKIWLSHRDLIQIINKSIDSDVGYGVYYAISNNKGTFLDISNARKDLNYQPEDNRVNISPPDKGD